MQYWVGTDSKANSWTCVVSWPSLNVSVIHMHSCLCFHLCHVFWLLSTMFYVIRYFVWICTKFRNSFVLHLNNDIWEWLLCGLTSSQWILSRLIVHGYILVRYIGCHSWGWRPMHAGNPSFSGGSGLGTRLVCDMHSGFCLSPRSRLFVLCNTSRGISPCKLFSLNTISLVQRVENYL